MALIEIILYLTGLNTALILISEKWGLIEWYELYKPKFAPDTCYFCLSFWMGACELIGLLIFGIIDPTIYVLSIPFIVAGFSQKLMR